MSKSELQLPSIEESVGKWGAGFAAAIFAFVLLPKTAKYVIRKLITRLVLEIAGIIVVGLLSERVLTLLGSGLPDRLRDKRA